MKWTTLLPELWCHFCFFPPTTKPRLGHEATQKEGHSLTHSCCIQEGQNARRNWLNRFFLLGIATPPPFYCPEGNWHQVLVPAAPNTTHAQLCGLLEILAQKKFQKTFSAPLSSSQQRLYIFAIEYEQMLEPNQLPHPLFSLAEPD